jgi:hypothetical protein
MTNARVLVVDDEPAIRMIVSQLLRREGYDTVEVGTAEAACQWVEESPITVDLVIVDVRLPGMSGPEFAGWLLGQNPRAKILFVSGLGEECTRDLVLFSTSMDTLGKPFHPDALVAKVARLLEGRAAAVPGAARTADAQR